jgi:hypothetical protein
MSAVFRLPETVSQCNPTDSDACIARRWLASTDRAGRYLSSQAMRLFGAVLR